MLKRQNSQNQRIKYLEQTVREFQRRLSEGYENLGKDSWSKGYRQCLNDLSQVLEPRAQNRTARQSSVTHRDRLDHPAPR